jgi:hypothetical protein
MRNDAISMRAIRQVASEEATYRRQALSLRRKLLFQRLARASSLQSIIGATLILRSSSARLLSLEMPIFSVDSMRRVTAGFLLIRRNLSVAGATQRRQEGLIAFNHGLIIWSPSEHVEGRQILALHRRVCCVSMRAGSLMRNGVC